MKHKLIVCVCSRNVTCSSPAHLRGRLVVYLVEQELLESCRYWPCNLALASQISLFIFITVQVLPAAETFTPEDDATLSNEYVSLKDRSM